MKAGAPAKGRWYLNSEGQLVFMEDGKVLQTTKAVRRLKKELRLTMFDAGEEVTFYYVVSDLKKEPPKPD